MKERFCEALRFVQDSEEKEARIEHRRSNRERFGCGPQLPFLYEVHKAALPGHSVLHSWLPPLTLTLVGDGRSSFVAFVAIPYISYRHIMCDYLHLSMLLGTRPMTPLPCLWCAQPADEQD
jgi:hypothetical protein